MAGCSTRSRETEMIKALNSGEVKTIVKVLSVDSRVEVIREQRRRSDPFLKSTKDASEPMKGVELGDTREAGSWKTRAKRPTSSINQGQARDGERAGARRNWRSGDRRSGGGPVFLRG